MIYDKLNITEIDIINIIVDSKLTISQISEQTKKSLSWISECVAHLENIDFIEIERKGLSRFVSPGSKSVSIKLQNLLNETNLNLYKILVNSRLMILPLLLRPGSNIKNIEKRTFLSYKTIKNILTLWKGMGIVILDNKTGIYSFNSIQKYLIQFVREYSENRNSRILKLTISKGTIVWQWRDEFIISISNNINHLNYVSAAMTRLNELDYELLNTLEYYYFSPSSEKINNEEAFIQSLRIDPNNPRIKRLLLKAIKKCKVNIELLQDNAKKYHLIKKLQSEVLQIV